MKLIDFTKDKNLLELLKKMNTKPNKKFSLKIKGSKTCK